MKWETRRPSAAPDAEKGLEPRGRHMKDPVPPTADIKRVRSAVSRPESLGAGPALGSTSHPAVIHYAHKVVHDGASISGDVRITERTTVNGD